MTSPHRNTRRIGRQDAAYGVSLTHSRRDPFSVDYGLWPFDNGDYDIICTVTNNIVNTNLSLWTPLLSADARRQACVQYKGRCCNCCSTENSLRWCPVSFKNTFSLLNPEFGTHDPDGSVFETWKLRMRRWRQRSPPRGRQGNHRRSGRSNHRPRYTNNRGHNPTYQGNPSRIPRAHVTTDACNFSQRPHHIPQTPTTTMRYGPGTTGAQPADTHIHAPPYGQHSHTPLWCEDGANISIALSKALPDGLLDTADISASTTRSVFLPSLVPCSSLGNTSSGRH